MPDRFAKEKITGYNGWAMIIYIYGADTFRSRQYLTDQVAKFRAARDPQGYNVVFLDCAKAEPGKVLSELMAAPFLAEKRMVVLENILTNNNKDLLGDLLERVKNQKIPESNIAVFYQSEAHSKIKEVKELDTLLQQEKYAKEFEALVGAPLTGWIVAEVKNRGGQISGAAAQYLAVNVGDDMWHLNSLIDQLVAYKKDEIQLADVQLFLDEKIDDNVFNLTDAIIASNHKLALKLLAGQRELGVEDPQIFGAILWQFRTLMSMRDLFEKQDTKSDDMAKILKLHPFVIRKNLPVIKKYSSEKLRQIYHKLLDIDIKTKTGFADQEILMDLFVAGN